MNTRLIFVHALSPIHCGTGQAVGGIDLPIAREKPTGIPLIPGSSIKGVLRAAGDAKDPMHRAVFGPETESASEHAGSVQFSDANLVFLPVRSIRGTFAWATSRSLLRRFVRDAKEAGTQIAKLPNEPSEKDALVTGNSKLQASGKVVFEDFDFAAKVDADLTRFADDIAKLVLVDPGECAHFVARVCLVNDDVMSLLLQTATEITARIRLEPETKTVAKGALWSEEALPTESILAGLVVATPIRQKDDSTPAAEKLLGYVRKLVEPSAIQLGGKATVGRGVCRVRVGG